MSFQDVLARLSKAPDPSVMDEVITFARAGKLGDHDIAGLATVLSQSGVNVRSKANGVHADVASTGGPSSLSTLLCPLFLQCFGVAVPKLGVAGRPAGAVDALAQIPGYRVILTSIEVEKIVAEGGYAHFLATGDHAPLDGVFFMHRRRVGAVALPELAIASLLSKKIAVGLNRVGLDVRVSPTGNFGATWPEAKRNAERFIRVASGLGIQAWCFLTDGYRPCQPYIGRGEALTALEEVAHGSAGSWLNSHARTCFAMAKAVAGADHVNFPMIDVLCRALERNLTAQGSDWTRFTTKVSEIRAQPRYDILAPKSGFLTVDLGQLRHAIVLANEADGAEDARSGQFSDWAGIRLLQPAGVYVLEGECIAELRCRENLCKTIIAQVEMAFTVVADGNQEFGFEVVQS